MTMLYLIVVDVIPGTLIIALVLDDVLPKTALPNASFSLLPAAALKVFLCVEFVRQSSRRREALRFPALQKPLFISVARASCPCRHRLEACATIFSIRGWGRGFGGGL